jgi:hypothetical protein
MSGVAVVTGVLALCPVSHLGGRAARMGMSKLRVLTVARLGRMPRCVPHGFAMRVPMMFAVLHA